MKPAVVVSIAFLSVVAVAHLLRIALRLDVTVGPVAVPMWASFLAVLGPGGLALWLWREQRA